MKITRLDLDGAGSPTALVSRILSLEPDLPIPVPVAQLCEQLDIISIAQLHTAGFEAALVTDSLKASGAILISAGASHERRRFSIGHELGHFLIPTHMPPADGKFLCSETDMLTLTTREQTRRLRMEAEANQFAALLLMPPPALKSELRRKPLELGEIIRLARVFEVSREAMARACIDNTRSAAAIVIVYKGVIQRMYRREGQFPFIEASRGQRVPSDSAFHDQALPEGSITETDECDCEVWLGERSSRNVELLEEQVLYQRNGFAMILLRAKMRGGD